MNGGLCAAVGLYAVMYGRGNSMHTMPGRSQADLRNPHPNLTVPNRGEVPCARYHLVIQHIADHTGG